jgi:tRNA-intron endonuclease, archaea type
MSKKVTKKSVKNSKTKSSKKIIKSLFGEDSITSSSKEAKDLYGNRLFGEYVSGKINYSFSEALYLVEKKKMDVYKNTKKLSFSELLERCKKIDKKIFVKYVVFKDLRDKGYLLKSALKFGADFRVYEPGARPGKVHAKWILFPVSEDSEMTWHDFSAKNRVAHSTKKNLLIAVVDSEGGITYYEINWKKP